MKTILASARDHGARLATVILAVACSRATTCAQDETAVRAWHAELRSEDPITLEIARRSLAKLAPQRLDREQIERGLADERAHVRRAAASLLLLSTGSAPLPSPVLAAWSESESDPAVLLDLVGALPLARCRQLVTTNTTTTDDDPDRAEQVTELRRRALVRCVRAGELSAADYQALLLDPDVDVAAFAAQAIVEAAWPLPTARLDEMPPVARERLLEALGRRPRPEAASALRRILDEPSLAPLDRLAVLVALGSQEWKDADARLLFEFATGPDQAARLEAESACRYLPPAAANRLIAQVQLHAQGPQESWDRIAFGAVLDLLSNIDARGERLLFALARELPEGPRDEIAAWLSRRGSPISTQLIEEAFDSDYPLTASIVRGAKDMLERDAIRARVLGLFQGEVIGTDRPAAPVAGKPSPSMATRDAGFDILCESAIYVPELLDYALTGEDDAQIRKVSMLLRLPDPVVMTQIVPGVLARAGAEPLRFLLSQLVRVELSPALEQTIQDLDREDLRTAALIDRVLIAAGSATVMEQVWSRLDRTRRIEWIDLLRERGDPAAFRLIAAEPLGESFDAMHLAKLAIGDRDVFAALLADPAQWPRTWLRRAESIVTPMLAQADVDRLVERFDSFADPLGAILLQWIGSRRDLDDRGLPARIFRQYETDLEREVRAVALRIELRRPDFRAAMGATLREGFERGVDERIEDEAFEWFGANPAPLDAMATRMLVDFAVRESLMRPRAEIATVVESGPPLAEPRVQLAFQRTIREECPPAVDAWRDGVGEAARHQAAHLAAQSRLLRILEILARSPALRTTAGPLLSRWILELPDFETRALGPAWQLVAEGHEAAGDFAAAAVAWDNASFAYLTHGQSPLVQRVMLGDQSRADRDDPTIWLWSRSPLCACRAALSRGNLAAARSAFTIAKARAIGDRRAEADVEVLRKELK